MNQVTKLMQHYFMRVITVLCFSYLAYIGWFLYYNIFIPSFFPEDDLLITTIPKTYEQKVNPVLKVLKTKTTTTPSLESLTNPFTSSVDSTVNDADTNDLTQPY